MRAVVVWVAVLVPPGFVGADEKIDAKGLIGRWEPAKPVKGEKMVLDIQDDGKLTLSVTAGDKAEKLEGTYKLDGNTLEVELAVGEKIMKETFTVQKLTATEMVTKDSKGRVDAMTRVKAK